MSPRVVTRWAAKGLLALVVLVGAPLVGMLLTRSSEANEAPKDALAKAAPTPGGPQVANDFVGVLLPPQMANLSPRADGKVLEIRAKAGQAVRKGDVLVAFDLREREHDLAIAEAQLKVARAEAAGAGSEYMAARKRAARRNATVDVGGQRVALVSGEEAAQSHFEAQSAGARAASAAAHIAEMKARTDQLRLALQESELRAPFDGVVSSINFEPGTTAHTGDIVARVVGGEGLRARIAVPEESASLLHARHARITIDGKVLMAAIDQVTPEAEPASRAFVVEGSVDLRNAGCTSGCSAFAGRPMRAQLEP